METIGVYFVISIQNFQVPTLNNPVIAPISEICTNTTLLLIQFFNVVVSYGDKRQHCHNAPFLYKYVIFYKNVVFLCYWVCYSYGCVDD